MDVVRDQDVERLVGLAQGGDAGAFEGLVRHYEKPVFSVLVRWLRSRAAAEDVFQEAMTAAFRHLHHYGQESRGGHEAEVGFRAWLFRIAVNKAKDFQRAERRQQVREQTWSELVLGDFAASPDHRLAASAVLEKSLEILAPADRLLLLLRFGEELSFAEMGAVLGASEMVVKMRVHRARSRFFRAASRMGKLEVG